MNYEAFVYIWYNDGADKRYIGVRKGHKEDGYISSSHNDKFWQDHEAGLLRRVIIRFGTWKECRACEDNVLKSIIDKSKWYNMFFGSHDYEITHKSRKIMSDKKRGSKNHTFGKQRSQETRDKIRASVIAHQAKYGVLKGEKHPLFGKSRSPETRAKISASMKQTLKEKRNA